MVDRSKSPGVVGYESGLRGYTVQCVRYGRCIVKIREKKKKIQKTQKKRKKKEKKRKKKPMDVQTNHGLW